MGRGGGGEVEGEVRGGHYDIGEILKGKEDERG